MDDYLDSAHTLEEAIKLVTEVTELHRRGEFQIQKWSCSSKEVLQKIPPELRSAEGKDLTLDEMNIERVLGLTWNPNSDTLMFKFKFHKVDPSVVSGERRPTKREVLSLIASVFDPLGLLTHFTIQGRILLQDIWRSELGWDDELTEHLSERWMTWLSHLTTI